MDGGGKVADVLFPLGGERSGARGQGVQSDQWEPPSGSPEPSGTLRATLIRAGDVEGCPVCAFVYAGFV